MENAAIPIWAIATIAGPVLLGAVLLFGRLRNRRRRRREAPATAREHR